MIKHRFFRRWLLWNLVQFHVTSSMISRKSGGILILFLHFVIFLMVTNFSDAYAITFLNLILVSLLISNKFLYLVSIVFYDPLVHSLEDLLTFQSLLLCETLLWWGLFFHYLNVCLRSWDRELLLLIYLFFGRSKLLEWIIEIYL